MKYTLSLGKILNVQIYIHWTFILLLGWIVIANLQAGSGIWAILLSIGFTVCVFCCIVFHELGHAMGGRKYNIVAKHITLFPIGGIAQFEKVPERPMEELLIALAGPAVNLGIAFILYFFVDAGLAFQPASMALSDLRSFVMLLFSVNIFLAVFNLIPAFPMDGGRVLRALLAFIMKREKATIVATNVGQLFGVTFFIAGFLYNPILVLIGLFIFFGSQYELSVVRTLQLLHNHTVNDALMKQIPKIENTSSVKEAAEMLLNTQNRNFVVTDNKGNPVGTINREAIVKAVGATGENTPVEVIQNKKLAYVSDEMPLDEAWRMLQQEKVPLILVKTRGGLSGILELENINEFILLKSASAEAK